jgi:hypothetical protein
MAASEKPSTGSDPSVPAEARQAARLQRLVARFCAGGSPKAEDLALFSFLACRGFAEAVAFVSREAEKLSRTWGAEVVFDCSVILKLWLHEGFQALGQEALYSALSRHFGVSDMDTEVPAIVEEGTAAFLRDMETLLKEHPRQWVAYHGSERVAVGKTDFEVLQDCLARGFAESELVIRRIQPDLPTIQVTW